MKYKSTFDKIKDRLNSVFASKGILETIFLGLVVFIIFAAIIGGIGFFIYCIYYAIVWVAFWLFGPLIFGYAFTWKTPIMLWFIMIIIRLIIRRK